MDTNRSASFPLANFARSSNSMKASCSRVMSTRVFGNELSRVFSKQPDFQRDIFLRRSMMSDRAGIFSAMAGIDDDGPHWSGRLGSDRTSRFRYRGAWDGRWSRERHDRQAMATSLMSRRSVDLIFGTLIDVDHQPVWIRQREGAVFRPLSFDRVMVIMRGRLCAI